MTLPDDVLARIAAAHAADGAAMVLDLPWQQTRAVLAALGPREVARLLLGVRADRLAELLDRVPPEMLPAVLANLSVPEIAELLPLVPLQTAVRVATSLPPPTAANLLLALPTQHRVVLQRYLPIAAEAAPAGGYLEQAEQAVRRATGTANWLDPRGGALLTEVFGRPVLIVIRDRPSGVFSAADLLAAVGATDWRRVSGLVVVTNAALDPGVGGGLREARQRGYLVEVVQWQDERDDGLLKRTLVRIT